MNNGVLIRSLWLQRLPTYEEFTKTTNRICTLKRELLDLERQVHETTQEVYKTVGSSRSEQARVAKENAILSIRNSIANVKAELVALETVLLQYQYAKDMVLALKGL